MVFLHYMTDASLPVKIVITILISASIIAWGYIFQQNQLINRMQRAASAFERHFRSDVNLHKLFVSQKQRANSLYGLEAIFFAGFRELTELNQQNYRSLEIDAVIANIQRAMRITEAQEIQKLEQHLNYLATVGSTSPYIGLFGTVWGIMTAFQALGAVQQASIAMVAPGISEALITTALGLFAAIPAVIAYNRFTHQIEQLTNGFASFQDEFIALLLREAHLYGNKDQRHHDNSTSTA